MLTKEAKTRILEDFYAIDYAILGKPIAEMELCCPILSEEYLSVKGALLSAVIEMYNLINYEPKFNKVIKNSKQIQESAVISAKESRGYAKKLVSSPMGKKSVKEMLKEDLKVNKSVNIDESVKNNIRKKAFALAMDHLLIGRTVMESKNFKKLDSWEGRIMENTYKILRNQLAETAFEILDNGKLE